MVNKLFLEQYCRKMLYFKSGVQLCRHSMNYYANLIDTEKLSQYFTYILHKYKFIPITDIIGGCTNSVCLQTVNLYKDKSDIFILLDDFYGNEKISCVYVRGYDITVISLPCGVNAREFYYSVDRRKESDAYYSDIAMEYFYISGDYCQENNDMV